MGAARLRGQDLSFLSPPTFAGGIGSPFSFPTDMTNGNKSHFPSEAIPSVHLLKFSSTYKSEKCVQRPLLLQQILLLLRYLPSKLVSCAPYISETWFKNSFGWRTSRLVINHFPNNLYIKRKHSLSCLRIWTKSCGLQSGYEHILPNTFQNNACFTIFGQFHNDGSKKPNANPNPTKNPNPVIDHKS